MSHNFIVEFISGGPRFFFVCVENFCVAPVFFSFSKDLKFVIDTRRQVKKRSCHTSAVFNCLNLNFETIDNISS